MTGTVRTITPEIVLNVTQRVLQSGKLLYIIQRESGSVADSGIIKDGIGHNKPKEV